MRAWLACLCGLLTGCVDSPEIPPSISPPSELALLEPAVRRQFEHRHQALERILARTATSDQIAAAFAAVGETHFAYDYLYSAERAFENATALAPENPRWHYYLARTLQALGLGQEAESSLRMVLELKPEYLPSRVILAEVFASRGDTEAADQEFDAVTQLDRGNARAWVGRSRIALQRGEPQEALEFAQEALTRQPDAPAVHYQLALSYRSLGQMEAAQAHLERIPPREAAPTGMSMHDPWMRRIAQLKIGARVHDQRAKRALAAGRYDLAALEFRQILASHPGRIYARHGLAASLSKLGQHREAIVELQPLLDEVPTHVPSMVLKSTILLELDQVTEAAEVLDRALEIDPSDPAARRLKVRISEPSPR